MAKRTILLVDDDVTLRELLADALELQGFTILRVIYDILMPEMNGWELCQKLGKIALLAMVRLPQCQEGFKVA